MLVAVAVIVGLWFIYKHWVSIYSHWKKRDIPFYPAEFPYGSHPNLVKLKQYRGYTIDKMYHEFAPHPMFGIYVLRKPMLVVRDPEMIQLILAKEFSHFRDRGIIKLSDKDVINHHLFNLDGERWRALRMKLTPTFTSGRLKSMFPLFVSCAESFSSLLLSKVDSKVDIKELTGRFTADVICSCAFGLETDVINHPDNKLRNIGIEGIKLKFLMKLKMAILRIFPKLSSLLPIRFISVEDENYLINLVKNIVEQREKNGIVRNDFIDLLIQLKNKENPGDDGQEFEKPFEMTLEFMTAQCFVFFVAGFETSSSVQSFCLYELALHQDIQSRLIEEINEKIEKNGGLTYKALQEMEYLDMVISETSRKYPTVPTLVRQCTKSITLPAGQKMEQDTLILIPVWSLHHDPQYFPNPEKFDPGRFSQENKDSIVPYTYLPFGEGPRMCIGMRFGLLQTKVGIVTLLQKFQVVPCEETQIPLVMGGISATTASDKPIIIKLIARCTIDKMYYKFSQHPMFGIFSLRNPMLIIRDPEMVQLILTKEFSNFRDRGIIKVSEKDVLNNHLFNLAGEKWRVLRMKLTPTFTSGKLKAMFPLFVSCAENFSSLLMSKVDSKVDIKELIGRFTADVICSCAFGLETDVINHPDNKLRRIGISRIQLTFLAKLKVALSRLFPGLLALFNIRFIPLEDENYIMNLVENIVEQREKNGIVRNDFIDLLMQLKNKGSLADDGQEFEKPFEMTLGFMAAQCFVFFLAGFETSSSVQSFCLYELALHQDMQSRLIEEINEKIKKNGGLTYKALQEMEYLDMVVSETTRKYPTLPTLVRQCTKSVTLPTGQKIEQDTMIIIPVWSLHHDPQYFPNPEKFDPERFSEENKESIVPYTFLPFGEGPRMCIGMRFGVLQTKVGIVTLLQKFQVEPCEETEIPLVMGGSSATTASDNPIIIKLRARS
ncbi:probable cytochrome P450 6a14 [Halyomorpha halys]|uniref:probable cytochrome P450 6a14 n=1 Tax=Halyomorpha halys TaxID=286706 RepID=UPI0034D2A056